MRLGEMLRLVRAEPWRALPENRPVVTMHQGDVLTVTYEGPNRRARVHVIVESIPNDDQPVKLCETAAMVSA